MWRWEWSFPSFIYHLLCHLFPFSPYLPSPLFLSLKRVLRKLDVAAIHKQTFLILPCLHSVRIFFRQILCYPWLLFQRPLVLVAKPLVSIFYGNLSLAIISWSTELREKSSLIYELLCRFFDPKAIVASIGTILK